MKKFLSLVLALAMTLSLVTISAGAKDFADSDELSGEQYEEAVNVMSEMGIIDGYASGDFQPQGTLTRGAAAKIIACMMLGKTTAEALGTQAAPFKDVPVGSTFAGYIAYCVEAGLIDGYADGTFRPGNTLTGFAFLKMLLTALGYDSSIEGYTGTNWTVNVASRATQIGLTDGNEDFVGTRAATREEACLYAVNALQATLVEYADKGQEIVVNDGTVITVRPSAPTFVTSSIAGAATSIDDTIDNTTHDYTVEFAEKYQPDLELDHDVDVFSRPAHTWSWKGQEIGTYVDYDLMVAEYTTSVTGRELYDVVGKTAFDDYGFESHVDGKESDLYKEISKNNKDDVSETGNGALTQVFVDAKAESVVVTVINTYLAQATADYNEKKEEASFQIYGLQGAKKNPVDVSAEDFDIADVAEDDFVLVTYSFESEEIESIDDVETLSEVTVNKFTSNDVGNNSGTDVSSVTVDGTKYDSSNKLSYDVAVLENYTNSNLKDKTYNVYLDAYGYAIGVEEVDAPDNYLFLTGINGGTDYLATANYEANVIFMDGASDVVKVKNNADIRTAINNADGDALVNQWFKFTKNSSDVYTLSAITMDMDTATDSVGQYQTLKSDVPEINDRHLSLKAEVNNRLSNVYGNEDTVYLIAELDTVTAKGDTYGVITKADEVIVGADNVDADVWNAADVRTELKLAAGDAVSEGVYALYDDEGVVIAAVVVGESQGTASNVVYVNSSKASEEGYADGEWTWTREVVLNGELVTLTEVSDEDESVLADEMKQYNWYTVKYDADGNVKKATIYNEKTEADNFAVNLVEAVKELRNEDLVILDVNKTGVYYSKNGRTIYDWGTDVDKQADNGVIVSSDVKFVLRQINKNKVTTEEYTGWNQLVSTLETLNANPNRNYDFNAVIEKGRITSVVIIDYVGDGYVGPDGTIKGNVKTVLKGSSANVTDLTVASNGVLNMKINYTAPAYAAEDATVTFNLDVYANGKFYRTITGLSGTLKGDKVTIPYTSNWFASYPTDETLSFVMKNEDISEVEVYYVDGNGNRIESQLAAGYDKKVSTHTKEDVDFVLAGAGSTLTGNATITVKNSDGAVTDWTNNTWTGAISTGWKANVKGSINSALVIEIVTTGTTNTYTITDMTSGNTLALMDSDGVITSTAYPNDYDIRLNVIAGASSVGPNTPVTFTVQLNKNANANPNPAGFADPEIKDAIAYRVEIAKLGVNTVLYGDTRTTAQTTVTVTPTANIDIDPADVKVTPIAKPVLTSVTWNETANTVTLNFDKAVTLTAAPTLAGATFTAQGSTSNVTSVTYTVLNHTLVAGDEVTISLADCGSATYNTPGIGAIAYDSSTSAVITSSVDATLVAGGTTTLS